MKFFVAILLSIAFTLVASHPLEKSSEDEKDNHGTSSTVMKSSTQPPVPSMRMSKLLSSRRRINSRMMVDPQMPSESYRVESSGTFRTITNDEEPIVRSSRRRRIESPHRAIPLTRSASDQSRKPSSASLRQQPYIFPYPVSSSSNIRRASTQLKKKVAPGYTTDKKKNIEKKKVEENKEDEISSEGVSLNPPEFEEVRNSPSVKLDINTIGRLMSNPKKSGSLIDLASYRRVSNGQDPVFYGNDMIFHREPSYDDNDDTVDRTRNSLSVDPNSEFVLIKK